MFERTQTLPLASPPTAMRFAVSSAGVVLISELISGDPHGRTVTNPSAELSTATTLSTLTPSIFTGVSELVGLPPFEPGVEQSRRRGGSIGKTAGSGPEPPGDVDNDLRAPREGQHAHRSVVTDADEHRRRRRVLRRGR